MRLRYAVPFTVLLLILVSVASTARINLYFVLVGVTAVWIAFDSRRIRLTEYATWMAQPPLALGVAAVVAWPLFFPVYLRTRHRVLSDRIAKGDAPTTIPDRVTAVAAFVVIVAGVGWIAARPLVRQVNEEVLPLAQGISAEFQTTAHVRIQGTFDVTVSLPGSVSADSMEERAFAVARYVHRHRRPEPHRVVVRFIESERRGFVTVTRQYGGFEWTYRELREAAAGDSTSGAWPDSVEKPAPRSSQG